MSFAEEISPWTGFKFDEDFYRTPNGEPFFLDVLPVLGTGPRGVFYRWDATLAIAYTPEACTRVGPDKHLYCHPMLYIESDKDVRQLVQGLIDKTPSSTQR